MQRCFGCPARARRGDKGGASSMALFPRGGKNKAASSANQEVEETRPLVGRELICRVCEQTQRLTRCWRRLVPMRQCACCGQPFENPAALYAQFQPHCPRCAEALEQPNFDYGLCDGCGTKYEIVENTKPGLIPNRKQREEIRTTGRIWTKNDRPQ